MEERKRIDGMKVVFSGPEIMKITQNIADVLRSGHLIKGLFSDPFAKAISGRCGKDKAVLCSSDTAAMEMLFRALNVNGAKVVFQGNMFPSPVFACMRAGGTPVYADIEFDYLGMDPQSLSDVLKEHQAKVVVVMHTAGIISPNILAIAQLCAEKGIVLIEDCAHAYGSVLEDEKTGVGWGAGAWGDFAVFSFYATKPMNCGEGGAVAADEARFHELENIEKLARYGKTELFGAPYCEMAGYSNRMTEILCAVGIVEDECLNFKVIWRKGIAKIYNDDIHAGEYNTYGLIQGQNFYKYVIMPDRIPSREAFRLTMKEKFNIGIPAGVYDFPVYDQPPLKRTRPAEPLPHTERFCYNHICLPMHDDLTGDDAMFVARAVNEVLGG